VSVPAPAQEHEFEAAHGLPEQLPPGERIIWQGSPDWRTLAVQVMYIRTIAIYFAAMLLWRGGTVFSESSSVLSALQSIALPLPLALVALGLLALFARLTSQTTVYTITNQRVVMRIGIVLSVTFNLPYRMIESANLRENANGTGDIALLLAASDKIAYANLWPHARPWKVKRPEPMLRVVPQSAKVGKLLAAAIGDVLATGRAPAEPAAVRHHDEAPVANDERSPHGGPLTA
jgi:Bacterial PH domain